MADCPATTTDDVIPLDIVEHARQRMITRYGPLPLANGLGKVGKKTCVMFTEHFSGTLDRPVWAQMQQHNRSDYAPS